MSAALANDFAGDLPPISNQQSAISNAEVLRCADWAALLDVTPKAVLLALRRRGIEPEASGSGLCVAFDRLPEEYQARLEALRVDRFCKSFADLLTVGERWQAPIEVGEMTPHNRARALAVKEAMRVYFEGMAAGQRQEKANDAAQAEYARQAAARSPELVAGGHAALQPTIGKSTVFTIRALVDAAGGIGLAPLQAYGHKKQVPHMGARLTIPEELVAVLKDRATRFGEWNAAVRSVKMDWLDGQHIPGVGRISRPGEPFPFTDSSLEKLKPSKAARMVGSKGKFLAKTNGFLPAPLLSSKELRLRERIVFDDKRVDIVAKDDTTGRPVDLVIYFGMDESTRQILGYILRETGGIRQTDVEALCAFVLGRACFAGRSAGYATTLKFERGTVAISTERQELLEAMFPNELIISRTSMIGGKNGPGQYGQKSAGNFMGKGKLEAFMGVLDHYLLHLPGQRGNVYQNTPAMLGDLLLTPEKMASPNYKPTGSMIEEAVACAQTARALAMVEGGSSMVDGGNGNASMTPPGAYAAAQATGVKGPLLFVSEVNSAVQAVVAWWNAERGHRREGFASLAIVQADGSRRVVTESGNDKAARLSRELAAQGKKLQRISDADITVLLHKVKRITVRPGGAKVTVGGVARTYWHPDSLAVDAAQHSTLGEKTYLALYNPEDPVALYLLSNCPSHVAPTADELPRGEQPTFFEALPLYTAPEVNDAAGMAARSEQVQRNHSRVMLEHNKNIVPFVVEETERRATNTALAEPLRRAVTALREEAAAIHATSALGQSLPTDGDAPAPTRAQQKANARPELGTAEDFREALQSDR